MTMNHKPGLNDWSDLCKIVFNCNIGLTDLSEFITIYYFEPDLYIESQN